MKKRKNKLAFIFLLLFLNGALSYSQIDTSFWFAAGWVTPDHTWKEDYKVHISGQAGTVVRLRQPAAIPPNKYDTTFTIPGSGLFNYTFWRDKIANSTNLAFDSLEVRPADVVLPYGLYISSTSTITVVFDYVTRAPNFLNTETMSMKGQNGLGTEFVCPFQTIYRNKKLTGDLNGDGVVTQPKQQINIVATQSNTIVWITPRCNVVGHPANVTYSVLLPSPGSAYTCENMVQNTYLPGMSLAGTIVSSNRPIAVNVTDDSVNNPDSDSFGSIGCYDLMGDQIVPVDIVGTDYVLNLGHLYEVNEIAAGHPGMRESGYVVGTENFTQLTINDGGVPTTTLINKGETFRYQLTQPLTYVNANKNVYVIHASGYGCELGEAILPPLSCAGSSLVAFSRNSAQRFALNILCKNGAQGSFTLNNSSNSVTVPIVASDFTVVPGTGTLAGGPYYGAQINLNPTALLPIDSYTIANTSTNTAIREFALGVFDGNLSSGGLYHYMSSFLRRTSVETETITPVCAGVTNTAILSGTVAGAANSGIWTTTGGGTINPVYISDIGTISTIYTLSPAEAASTTTLVRIFTLTSIGCSPKSETVSLLINPLPVISVGSGTAFCKNNVSPINLTGSFTNAVNATWSGGNGGAFGPPGPNTTYTPSLADISANTITLTLTSSGPLQGCIDVSSSITFTFTDPAVVSITPAPNVCTNSQTLNLSGNVSGVTNTGTWTSSGTGIYTPSNAAQTTYSLSAGDLTLTTIIFSLTSTNNGLCASVTNTMQVNVIPQPVVVASADFPWCANAGPIPLSGTVTGAATNGSWTTSNGGGPPIAPNNSVVASYTMSSSDTLSGSVTFILHSEVGICPSVTDTLIVNILKVPAITILTNSLSFCENSPVVLSASLTGGTTYTWVPQAPASGSFDITGPNVLNAIYYPSPLDVATGSVVFSFSVSNPPCPATDKKVTAYFVDAAKANITFPKPWCESKTVLFSALTNTTGFTGVQHSWDFGNGNSTIANSSPQLYNTVGTYSVTYTVTATDITSGKTCTDVLDTIIRIFPNPVASFSVINACEGAEVTLVDNTTPTIDGIKLYSWKWTVYNPPPEPATVYTGTNTISHFYNFSGANNQVLFSIETNNGCVDDTLGNFTVNSKPNAEFGMTNNPSVAQEPVYFSDFSTPTGGINSWYWNFGDENSSNEINPTHAYENAGIFLITLTVTDFNGCTDTVNKNIEITLLPQVPTAFTPNSDNNNDFLFVKGGPFEKMIFRVYNNWGELIFETTDQKTGWDGKKNGIEQPVGVYVWTLEADMYNNRQVKKNGDVTLIR